MAVTRQEGSGSVGQVKVSIAAPREMVFDLMADLAESSRIAGSPRVKQLTAPPIQVGTEWGRISILGKKTTDSIVIAFDRPFCIGRKFLRVHPILVEDRFEREGQGTILTRHISLEVADEGTIRWLLADYDQRFHRLKQHIEREYTLICDARNPAVIEATRNRIRDCLGLAPDSGAASPTETSGVDTRITKSDSVGTFGTSAYPYARQSPARHIRSSLHSLVVGPIDTYITYLYCRPLAELPSPLAKLLPLAATSFAGWRMRCQVIQPTAGFERPFWNDAITLLGDNRWSSNRAYILMTGTHPLILNNRLDPIISIDITNMLYNDLLILLCFLLATCSHCRLPLLRLPRMFAGRPIRLTGCGQCLFGRALPTEPPSEKVVSERHGADKALDFISLPLLVSESMRISLFNCDPAFANRLYAFCEETIDSREGAASFKSILEMRYDSKKAARPNILPGESDIRDIWK